MRLFPDFTAHILHTKKCRAQRCEKNPGKHLVWGKVHWNQGWNLVNLSQIKIPWLSLTLKKFPDFPEENFFPVIFPDFPWCWKPCSGYAAFISTLYCTDKSAHLLALTVSPKTSATSPEQTDLILSFTIDVLPQPLSPTNMTGFPKSVRTPSRCNSCCKYIKVHYVTKGKTLTVILDPLI